MTWIVTQLGEGAIVIRRYAHWYAHDLHGGRDPECYAPQANWLIILHSITPSQFV